MIIVKHKTIDLTPAEIMQAAAEHNPPAGTVIDITDGTITRTRGNNQPFWVD